MAGVPNSFKDPYWAQLASATETKLELPQGLLLNVVTRGERSNADQVSEAGAKTPFQIIPSTRKAAIEKYGVDPYLSAENAAEVAGRLLKDSLDRNNGDTALAVAEYHGGTDRANWGPRTKSYVARVMTGLRSSAAQAPPVLPTVEAVTAAQSTFQRVQAEQQAMNPQEPQIAAIYNAYQSGQMTPQEAAEFEQDVQSGLVMLPRGAALNSASNALGPASNGAETASNVLPAAVVDAYLHNRLTPQERAELEQDVQSGLVHLPEGVSIAAKLGAMERVTSLPGQIKEAVTGTQRRTGETEATPDWATMPELNSFSMASAKTGLGTLLSNPDETVKVIQSNFPGVQARQDDKGNYFLRSSIDGKEYAIKPGFRVSDIPRAIGGIAAFTPAGRATTVAGAGVKSAATQAAIEGTQVAAGGEFNPGDVALAGGMGAAVPAVVNAVRGAGSQARQMLQRVRGEPAPAVEAPAAVVPAVSPEPPAPRPAPAASPAAMESAPASASTTVPGGTVWRSKDADYPIEIIDDVMTTPDGRAFQKVRYNGEESFVPQDEIVGPASSIAPKPAPSSAVPAAPAAATMGAEDLAATARKAATGGFGSKKATQTLAEQAAPDPETVAAAERLGVLDHLQPDHFTTNQAYRQLAQLVKSQTGSPAAVAQREGLMKVTEAADDLVTKMGGNSDLSTLSANVAEKMQAAHSELKARADKLYDEVRIKVPARAPAPADNVIQLIEQRAADLGGKQNLSSMEKSVLAKLKPKAVKETENIPGNPLMPGSQAATKRAVQTTHQPTYALLDDVRRDLVASQFGTGRGAFKDADDRLVDMVAGALRKDQEAAATAHGVGDVWNMAQSTAAAYKGIQNDLKAIYGKHLDKSMTPILTGAIEKLSTGDASKFFQLIRATPKEMRREVVASGLASFFQRTARGGEMNFAGYARWYEGLQRNKAAHTALMMHLPKGAPQQLADLARVARGVAMSKGEFIATGKALNPKALEAADNLMGRVFEEVRRRGMAGVATEVAGSAAGAPGLATVLQSAVARTKTPAVKAVDSLITSPEFVHAVKSAGKPEQRVATMRLAHSKPFTKFVLAIGKPRELSNRERWVLQAMQAQNEDRAAGGPPK